MGWGATTGSWPCTPPSLPQATPRAAPAWAAMVAQCSRMPALRAPIRISVCSRRTGLHAPITKSVVDRLTRRGRTAAATVVVPGSIGAGATAAALLPTPPASVALGPWARHLPRREQGAAAGPPATPRRARLVLAVTEAQGLCHFGTMPQQGLVARRNGLRRRPAGCAPTAMITRTTHREASP